MWMSPGLLAIACAAILASSSAPLAAAEVVDAACDLWIIQPDGGGLQRVVSEPFPGFNNCGTPGWSPDGTRIICDATPGKRWNLSRIVILHLTGDQAGTAEDLGVGVQPTWSPDGTRIAFYINSGSLPNVEGGLYLMNSDGTDRRLVSKTAIQPRWAPSGRWLLCTDAWNTSQRLHRVEPETGRILGSVAIPGTLFLNKPALLDDQTALIGTKTDGKNSLALVDISGKGWVRKTISEKSPELKQPWASPDGKSAVGIVTLPKLGNQLATIPLTAEGSAAEWTRLEPELGTCFVKDAAWSPQGDWIVFSSSPREGEIPTLIPTAETGPVLVDDQFRAF